MESETIASPTERYEKRIAFFSEQAKTFDARSRRYSNLRLAIVLLGAASVFVIPKNNAFGVGVLAGFLVLLEGRKAVAEILVQGDRTRLHPESPGCRQRVSSKARFPTRARMRNAPVAKFNVVQRRVTGIPSFRFAVRSGFLVRPKLGWLLTKMTLGTRDDPELCGVFPLGKKRQEESQIGNQRRSHHRALDPSLPLRNGGVSDLPRISRTQEIAGTSDRQDGKSGRPRQSK